MEPGACPGQPRDASLEAHRGSEMHDRPGTRVKRINKKSNLLSHA